jgi:hypothetical protein
MLQDLSPIQNHILSKLKNAKKLRYSEIQPEKVPNDLFNYHLQYLVKKELIVKVGQGYSLAQKGLRHVADPYTGNDAITSLFKINVITLVSRVRDGKIEILNQIRKSNPSYGKVGAPGGVVLKGELIGPAATRKLKQETGLDAEFKVVGCERRIMYKGGELFSDVMFPIAYASSCTGELKNETQFGENMWVPIDRAIKNESAVFDSIESIPKVLKAIKKGTIKTLPFFLKENIQSDSLEE